MQFHQSNLLLPFSNMHHYITTRNVGNIAFHVNDNKEDVLQRHLYLANTLHYEQQKLIYMQQIHSNSVHIVRDTDNFNTPIVADALITNKKNTPLLVMVADCTPLMFYDPKQGVISVAHAGRLGTFTNIVHNVLTLFKEHFHSNPHDIYVASGASIMQEDYEVGEDIYHETQTRNLTYAIKQKNNKYYLDIRAILLKQLHDEDILHSHIDLSTTSTYQHTHTYYSYRAEGQTGRFGALMMLV